MAGQLPRRFRNGSSPFDNIAHYHEETGEPWWSARDLMPFLNYVDWRNLENVIRKAKSACRNSGHQPSDHFVDVTKMVEIGSGGRRTSSDVHMTRLGCYLVTMNGDPDKAEVAAAQNYFAYRTRQAELAQAAHDAVPPAVDRPWSVRFRETMLPHVRFVNIHHPGCFTVVTALVAPMLVLEDEIIRHMMTPQSSDRPDVSIGLRWSQDRKFRGLPEIQRFAELELPGVPIKPWVSVYEDSERGTFEAWFYRTYLPNHLPTYLMNKPEFKVFGPLPPASAADHTCRGLTGQPAKLGPPIRRQLAVAGGFISAGATPPALGGYQRTMFD